MVRTIALGILIAGITPNALANSSVISIDNKQQIVEAIDSTTLQPGLNLLCTFPDLSANCSAKVSPQKLEINSNLWIQEVAKILFPHSPLSSCLQRTPELNHAPTLLSDRNDEIEPPLNSLWQFKIPAEQFFPPSNISSLSDRVVDSKCILSRRERGERKLTAPKARETTKFSSYSSLQNYSQRTTSTPSASNFPKLSRSSLVVAFPQENSSFIPRDNKLANPAPETKRIASPFGWRKRPYSNQLQFHQGIDYGAPYGSPVVAVGNGIVTKVVSGCADFGNLFCGGQLGNWIEIDHGNGAIGVYGHLKHSSITVTEGMKVWKNQNIAQVGSSGWSTGAHLDFRFKIDGKHEDPAKYLMAIDPSQAERME